MIGIAIPTNAIHLYLPKRDTNCPEMTLLIIKPSIKGERTRPLFVAEMPRTPCAYSGMNRIEPNIPILVIIVIKTETLKMRFLNRLGSIIGCAFCQARHIGNRPR